MTIYTCHSRLGVSKRGSPRKYDGMLSKWYGWGIVRLPVDWDSKDLLTICDCISKANMARTQPSSPLSSSKIPLSSVWLVRPTSWSISDERGIAQGMLTILMELSDSIDPTRADHTSIIAVDQLLQVRKQHRDAEPARNHQDALVLFHSLALAMQLGD